jgi:hypothetical protein
MRKLINKFIVWYLLRHCNAVLRYNGKVIRVFSQGFYDDVVREYFNAMARTRAEEKGGAE